MIGLAIDPGLDGAGFAFFTLPDRPLAPFDAIRAWRGSMHVRTAAAVPLTQRLYDLHDAAADAAEADERPTVIWIEQPSRAGDYARSGKRNRDDVNKLYMAIGAILSGIEAVQPPTGSGRARIELITADRTPKEKRLGTLRSMAHAAGIGLPAGPRGGSSGAIADELDAIYIGWNQLLTYRPGAKP